jgi:hypothetical protein
VEAEEDCNQIVVKMARQFMLVDLLEAAAVIYILLNYVSLRKMSESEA